MSGFIRVTMIGHLGADPDVRYSKDELAIATISVAATETWKNKEGQKQEHTEWVRVKFFNKLAEIVGEYLKKGRQVYIEGRLRTDKYTDKEGIERYATYVVGDKMQMLGSGESKQGNRVARAPQTHEDPEPPEPDDDFPDDSIPFD